MRSCSGLHSVSVYQFTAFRFSFVQSLHLKDTLLRTFLSIIIDESAFDLQYTSHGPVKQLHMLPLGV